MGLYPACSLPWIDTVANQFATNTSVYNNVDFTTCCTAPGSCFGVLPIGVTCPLGFLDCSVGNSRYVCNWNDYSKTPSTTCYQEGILEHTRSVPCCSSELTNFLKAPNTCVPSFGTAGTTICCTGPQSCSFVLGCIGYDAFNGHGGQSVAVYTGFNASSTSSELYCVQEMTLGNPVGADANCLGVTLPANSCSVGGAGPSLPPSVTTGAATTSPAKTGADGSPSTTAGPGGAKPNDSTRTGGVEKFGIKWVAVMILVPTLVQLLSV